MSVMNLSWKNKSPWKEKTLKRRSHILSWDTHTQTARCLGVGENNSSPEFRQKVSGSPTTFYPERPIRKASQGPLFTALPQLNDLQALKKKKIRKANWLTIPKPFSKPEAVSSVGHVKNEAACLGHVSVEDRRALVAHSPWKLPLQGQQRRGPTPW